MSNSIQRLSKIHGANLPYGKVPNVNLWSNIDERFIWNSHLMEKFIPLQAQFGNWFHPVIQGFVETKQEWRLGHASFGFALVSRRCKKKVGTRFNSRGFFYFTMQ